MVFKIEELEKRRDAEFKGIKIKSADIVDRGLNEFFGPCLQSYLVLDILKID